MGSNLKRLIILLFICHWDHMTLQSDEVIANKLISEFVGRAALNLVHTVVSLIQPLQSKTSEHSRTLMQR